VTTALAERRRGWLPPTATYARREYRVEPPDFANGGDAVPCDLVLFVLVTVAGKRWARTTWSRYAVQVEWEAAVDHGARSFLLENLDEPDAAGPFRCVVGSMREECGCEAGGFDRRRTDVVGCKHRAALSDLVSKGVM